MGWLNQPSLLTPGVVLGILLSRLFPTPIIPGAVIPFSAPIFVNKYVDNFCDILMMF